MFDDNVSKLLTLCLCTLVAVTAITTLPPKCPDQPLAVFPDYTNCSKFWICDQGDAIHVDCPNGNHFDEVYGNCTDPETAACRLVECDEDELDVKPHPAECRRYFICDYGELIEWECETENHFNDYLDRCTDPVEALCDIDLICPNDDLQTLPHPYNCTKYFICEMSSAIPRECPAGQHYSPEEKRCDDWELVGCSLCPDEGLLNVAHPTNCSKYYLCVDGTSVEMECDEGDHFSPSVEHCVPAEEAGCEDTGNVTTTEITDTTQETTATSTTVFEDCGEEEISYLPDPTDCTKYYICFKGDLSLEECPSGTHFNPMEKKCDDPEVAGCEI